MKSFEQWWEEQKKYDIEYAKPEPVITPDPVGVPFSLECPVCGCDVSTKDWVEEIYNELRKQGFSEDETFSIMDRDDAIKLCGGSPRCCP